MEEAEAICKLFAGVLYCEGRDARGVSAEAGINVALCLLALLSLSRQATVYINHFYFCEGLL